MAAVKENSLQAKRLKKLKNRYWRLNNLYWQLDESGSRFLFKMNAVQKVLYLAMHWLNIIPKSRQHGITTFIAIFMLDACLFNSNMRTGLIAHKLADAKKIFRDKIKYAYDNLPKDLRVALSDPSGKLPKDDSQELLFANNSSIYVGTSMRSGTLQILHVSEYGWICTHAPAKAAEIKSGALETVHEGGIIFIEATAEGPIGDFPAMCEAAKTGDDIGPMEYKRHFFNWHEKESNQTDPKYVDIDEDTHAYFDKLEKIFSKKITLPYRAWYTAKKKTLKHLMFKEHPSTLEEAFIAAIEGAYYAQEISESREFGRICGVPYNPKYPVHTVCDLGVKANMPWIFFQVVGLEVHIIDYFNLSKKDDVRASMSFYKSMLDDKKEKYKYNYGKYFAPFDMVKDEIGTGQAIYETAKEQGIEFTKLPRERGVLDGVERVTNMFPSLYFDADKSKPLINAIAAYRREWLESQGMYAEKPVHDAASHPADALRYLSMVIEDRLYVTSEKPSVTMSQIKKLSAKYRRVG